MAVGFDRWPDRPTEVDWELAKKGMANLSNVMRGMGYDTFRPGQEDAIMSILAGQDTLVVLPTATGKTAVFTLPVLALEWGAVVFSPLVALMRDQVDGLERKGVAAACMSGIQTPGENTDAARRWADGEISMLYVAPERMGNPEFQRAMSIRRPDACIMDEAHCLSQWGLNFRAEYCHVGDFIQEQVPRVVIALTATMSEPVEQDVRKVLGLAHARKVAKYYRRENLHLTSADLNSNADVAQILRENRGPGIVYCSSKKRVEELAAFLGNRLNEPVLHFHADLTQGTKRTHQDQFMQGTVRVMVATNAFGMGVDKPDIRSVIHRDPPGSMEALVQEVGRAGRDGEDSLCMTFYSEQGLATQRFLIETSNPRAEDVQAMFGAICRMADKNGFVRATGKDLAQVARIDPRLGYATIETLKAHGVIERFKPEDKLAKIRQTGDCDDPKFDSFIAAAQDLGVAGADGFLEFDLDELQRQEGVTMGTVRNRIKKWCADGLIRYIEPYRGSDTVIRGRIEDVDLEMLKYKRNDAFKKFELVCQYKEIPDDEKHAFHEKYFRVSNDL